MKNRSVFDVVVVGFGLAGAVSALECTLRGAETIVFECAPRNESGGNSVIAGQGFIAVSDVGQCLEYFNAMHLEDCGLIEYVERFADLPDYLRERCDIVLQAEPGCGDFPEFPGVESITRWRGPCERGLTAVEVTADKVIRSGTEVFYKARVIGLEENEDRTIDVWFTHRHQLMQTKARHAVIIACGGFGARSSLSLGTPFARGDSARLASLISGRGALVDMYISGPYYAYRVPGTRTGVTPRPLYTSGIDEAPRLLRRSDLLPIGVVDNKHHGLQRRSNGEYLRMDLPDAYLSVSDDDLTEERLVEPWPDGHAEGWARRFFPCWSRPPSSVNGSRWRELKSSRLALHRTGRHHLLPVSGAILNTLGGVRTDSRQRVVGHGNGGSKRAYVVGEASSKFRQFYQGSANLTECIVSARLAIETIFGGRQMTESRFI